MLILISPSEWCVIHPYGGMTWLDKVTLTLTCVCVCVCACVSELMISLHLWCFFLFFFRSVCSLASSARVQAQRSSDLLSQELAPDPSRGAAWLLVGRSGTWNMSLMDVWAERAVAWPLGRPACDDISDDAAVCLRTQNHVYTLAHREDTGNKWGGVSAGWIKQCFLEFTQTIFHPLGVWNNVLIKCLIDEELLLGQITLPKSDEYAV